MSWVEHALHVARIVSNTRLITGYLPQQAQLWPSLFQTDARTRKQKKTWLTSPEVRGCDLGKASFLLLTQEVKRKLCSHGTSFLIRIYHVGNHTTADVVALGKYPKMSLIAVCNNFFLFIQPKPYLVRQSLCFLVKIGLLTIGVKLSQ